MHSGIKTSRPETSKIKLGVSMIIHLTPAAWASDKRIPEQWSSAIFFCCTLWHFERPLVGLDMAPKWIRIEGCYCWCFSGFEVCAALNDRSFQPKPLYWKTALRTSGYTRAFTAALGNLARHAASNAHVVPCQRGPPLSIFPVFAQPKRKLELELPSQQTWSHPEAKQPGCQHQNCKSNQRGCRLQALAFYLASNLHKKIT